MERIYSILRYIGTAIGAYLIGDNFFGTEITDEWWQGLIGIVITAVSVVHGIVTKTIVLEKFESSLRSILAFVGAFIVGTGKVPSQVIENLIGAVMVGVPLIYSEVTRIKSEKIQKNDILIQQLKSNKK